MTSGTLTVGDNFKVTSDGKLTCSSASIKGTITASTISGSTVSGSTVSGSTIYTGTSTSGWIIVDDYIKNRGSKSNGGRANIFANGTLAFYPNVNNVGGTFLLNTGARISMNAGVAISASADGSVTPGGSGKNLDLKACSGNTAYLGAMSGADGTGELAAVTCKGTGGLSLKSTLATDIEVSGEYALNLKTKTLKTYKYGTTTLVQGRDGYCKIGSGYLGFANGILVYIGTSESDCKTNTGTTGPVFTA